MVVVVVVVVVVGPVLWLEPSPPLQPPSCFHKPGLSWPVMQPIMPQLADSQFVKAVFEGHDVTFGLKRGGR